jgi:transcriptional regulator with XRE-family HTH domain
MKSNPRPVRKRKRRRSDQKSSYLFHIRERLGLTQAQFAELIGVTTNTYARFERGELGMRESTARLIELVAQQKEK